MDEKYLIEEIDRLEKEATYIRGRYDHYYDLYGQVTVENAALIQVLEQYRDVSLPNIGPLAAVALEKLKKRDAERRKRK